VCTASDTAGYASVIGGAAVLCEWFPIYSSVFFCALVPRCDFHPSLTKKLRFVGERVAPEIQIDRVMGRCGL